jgi:hypothetical protein
MARHGSAGDPGPKDPSPERDGTSPEYLCWFKPHAGRAKHDEKLMFV